MQTRGEGEDLERDFCSFQRVLCTDVGAGLHPRAFPCQLPLGFDSFV